MALEGIIEVAWRVFMGRHSQAVVDQNLSPDDTVIVLF